MPEYSYSSETNPWLRSVAYNLIQNLIIWSQKTQANKDLSNSPLCKESPDSLPVDPLIPSLLDVSS